MDQKSWLWKKRSSEKTLIADKPSNSLRTFEEEVLTEKTDLERDLILLNEKLSSSLSECNAKDTIAKKQVKIAEEAIAGWEKAETEAISLKQELDKVLQQKAAAEERIDHLDAALKECMQQLRFVREEQEKRVHAAVTKTSEEFQKIRIALDDKPVEAGKRLAKLDAENTQLNKALLGKDKVIHDLGKYRTQVEADITALLLRVESTEKENASLKYEVRVLEKELDIRNEEREFSRRTADVAQKQHQESVKRITKLETECQKLRLLVRKRMPGPATLAIMKHEVNTLAKDGVETRRRKSNPSPTTSMDLCTELAPDAPSERINLLTEQLFTMVEKNSALKDVCNTKSSETQFFKNMYAPAASGWSRAEGQGEVSVKGQVPAEGKYLCILQNHSIAATSDVGIDDKASCAESWATASISEIEHVKNEKQLGTHSQRTMATSDMSLMDDFAEMEKLAVVSADYPAGSSRLSSEEGNANIGGSGSSCGEHSSYEPGGRLDPVYDSPSPFISRQEILFEYTAANEVPEWLGDMLKMLLEHSQESQRNPRELLEDMKVVLEHNRADSTVFYGERNPDDPDASHNGSGHAIHTSSSKSLNLDASASRNGNNISNTERSGQKFGSNVSISIHKVLELLEGVLKIQSQDNGVAEFSMQKDDKTSSYMNSENPMGYTVRVFQWKSAELSAILQQFVRTCNGLLNGTADVDQFAQQVASSLEWVMNHCFSLQDVSSMKDAIRSHLDWDESMSESDIDSESANQPAECNSSNQIVALLPPKKEEGKTWNVEWANEVYSAVDLEGCLQSEIVKDQCPTIHLQEPKDIIENLHLEIETTKQSKANFIDQIEKQEMMKEDIESQLMETDHERRNACEKISHLENELEKKKDCCKGPEETYHDLKIQLKSMGGKEISDNEKHREKQLQNDWEITAASERLAECQETILNLGKQLKALASPSGATLFDKVVPRPESVVTSLSAPGRTTSRRSSLLDKMLAEDNDPRRVSPTTKREYQNVYSNSAVSTNAAMESTNPDMINHKEKSKTAIASMDVVPSKKNGGISFFRKLFWRRKKGNIEKTPFS